MAFSLRVRVRDLCDVVLIVFTPSIVPSERGFNEPLLIKKLILCDSAPQSLALGL
jgi:hypothetical protein